MGVYDYQISGMMASMAGDTSRQMFIPVGVAKQIAKDGGAEAKNVDGYYVVQVKAKAGVDVQDFADRSTEYTTAPSTGTTNM